MFLTEVTKQCDFFYGIDADRPTFLMLFLYDKEKQGLKNGIYRGEME